MCGNKWLGMVALVVAFITFASMNGFGFEHVLYNFGIPGGAVPHSDMNGYGHYLAPFSYLALYWSLFCVFLIVLALLFLKRGHTFSFRERVSVARSRMSSGAVTVMALAMIGFVATGGWIFYNTNLTNTYYVTDEIEARQANYEKSYKKYELMDHLEPVAVDSVVDLYPDERRLESTGIMKLGNFLDRPIDELFVSTFVRLQVNELNVPGASLVEQDAEVGVYRYEFAEPIQPGETIDLGYDLTWHHQGFENANANATLGSYNRVVANGTFVNNTEIMPTLGYNSSMELGDPNKRRALGLDPIQRLPKMDDPDWINRSQLGLSQRTAFRAQITTDADQIAIAPGYIVGEPQYSGSRVTYTYEMDDPIWPFVSFMSAEFEVARDQWQDVAIEIYYHPEHKFNIEPMIRGTKKSLAYFSREFSPYQYRQFRIIEFPRYASFAQAFPNTIPFSESIGFVADLTDEHELDLVFYVTAHEAAHQWFGDIVTCSSWPHAWLNEGFATYYALLYRRHALGEKDFNWHMGATLDRYLNACTGEKKRALIKHLYNDPLELFFDGTIYPGGASRLHLMRGWWGDALFEAAIQSYVREHAWQSVDTSALEQAFVAQGARDASMVFQQWVEAPGYPEVHLSWEWIQGELRIQVRQTHESSNSPSIGGHRRGTPWAFHFPLDIQWKNGRGVVQQERVWVRERESTFALAEPQAVAWVSFDPEVFVPARWGVEEDETFTRARMLEAPSVRDRSLALQQLVAHRSRASEGLGAADEAALWSVALDEGAHPRLRGQALEALGKVQAAVIKGSLGGGAKSVEAWLREPAPVAMAWLEAILKLQRDPRVRAVEDSVLADSTLHLRYRELVLQAQGERTLDGWLNERSSKSFEPSPR